MYGALWTTHGGRSPAPPPETLSTTMQRVTGTLFSVGFKRKTAATTSAELEAAAAARAEQDAAGFQQADEAASAKRAKAKEQMNDGKKQYSRNPDAVRKRREYAQKKKFKKPREKSVVDAEKAVASSFEKETHYIDGRGRKRKLKRLRTRADPSSKVGKGGKRRYTDDERDLVVKAYEKKQSRQAFGKPSFAALAWEMQTPCLNRQLGVMSVSEINILRSIRPPAHGSDAVSNSQPYNARCLAECLGGWSVAKSSRGARGWYQDTPPTLLVRSIRDRL